MELSDMAASAQMREVFDALAPMFQDKTLKLAENPREPKVRRKGAPNDLDLEMADPPVAATSTPAMRMLTTMAQLLIRHDQELHSLRKMDQFILF